MLSSLFKSQPNQGKQNWVSFKLTKAIESDDIDALNLYLTSNSKDAAALNASNIYGQTILMLTIHSRHTRLTVKTIAQKLVDVNALAKNGECALTIAMSYNDSVSIEYLLDRDDLNLQQHGAALFIWAVKHGFENIVKRLAARPWYMEFREANPAFSYQLLDVALTSLQFNVLRQLIDLKWVEVNAVAAAIEKHMSHAAFHEAIDQQQDLQKYILCHEASDFSWREFLAHNSEAYVILSKLGAAEMRFVMDRQEIRLAHLNFTVVNPDAFNQKCAYMEKLCLALVKTDNTLFNTDDLLKILLQCPTFNRDMVMIDGKTTNDLLREAVLVEQPAAPAVLADSSDEEDESDDFDNSFIACKLI